MDELRRRLAEPGPWAARFERLARAITDVQPGEAGIESDHRMEQLTLDCDQCRDLLDTYIDDELKGLNVRRLYPLVWRHLRRCSECGPAYNLLRNTLRQERAGELPIISSLPAPRLPFLHPPPAEALWITRLRSRLAGGVFGLDCILNPSRLYANLMAPTPAPARFRSADDAVDPHILVSDVVTLGEQVLTVLVTGIQDPADPDVLAIHATLTSSTSLPADVWGKLTWADQVRSAPVDAEGEVDFGQVSLAELAREPAQAGDRFVISFETRATPVD